MKKRILSLVLCAAMLLSMCLFLGAGIAEDTTADGSAESTESYIPAVNFTNVAPFVQANVQAANSPARAPMLAANANDGSTTPDAPTRTTSDAVVTEKTATPNPDGTYTIKLTSYTTGTVTEQQTTKPTDIVLVLDQSGSMAESDMTVSDYTAYTDTKNSSLYNNHNNLWYKQGDSYVQATVTRTEGYDYTSYNGQTNETYYNNRNNLYAYVNGQLQQVTVSETRYLDGKEYTYKIAGSGTTIAESKGKSNKPAFSGIDGSKLYLRTSYYEYAYSYTDNGIKVPLGTSTGADAQFKDATLYQKTDRKITRLDALKTAATNFVNQIAQKADAEGVDHRIAIVGFSSDGYNNTELLTGNTISRGSNRDKGPSAGYKYYYFPNSCEMNGPQYGNISNQQYQSALVDMSTAAGQQSAKNGIDALTAYGGTETNKGMDMAKQIFANDSKKGEDRNRVVVLFTDGVPGRNSNDSTKTINSTYANPAIKCAHDISTDYSATVYTVGIFGGANGENPQNLPYNGSWYDRSGNSISSTANRFMHLVSSNYPDAIAMDQPGNVNSSLKNEDSYYLSAGDADTLNNIFEKIGNNISTPSIELGSKAEVRDIVSPYFTAPTNAAGITVYAEKADYSGSAYTWTRDDSCKGMTAAVDGQTVTVTGFDYDANFVSQKGRDEANPKESGNFFGRRLVVEFNVTVKPEFLGGNRVPTNLPISGVYDESGNVVENFEYPRVDIPVQAPKLTGETKNIYYNGTKLTAEDLCTANIGANMGDYVDLSYSVDRDISNTEDGNYTVTVTATPKYTIGGHEQQPASETAQATVNVFKPEVTFKDSIIGYNATPNYERDNFGEVVWKHEGTAADPANMAGTAPTLTYTYAPAESALTEDTGVKVTVKIGDQDITEAVDFEHEKCLFSNCKYTDNCGYQFYVHINVFDLTIVKAAADDSRPIDKDQTFVFKVTNTGTGKTMEVVITGEGQQTIKNLPVGEYTITEDTSWSWKYTPVDKNGAAAPSQTITATGGATTVTFENENKGTNWLTSLAKAINTWAGGNANEKTN